MKDFSGSKACWIWNNRGEPQENQYVEFRREFTLDSVPADGARLSISADSNYALWVNGLFVDCGQYSDFPSNKSYDAMEVGKYLKQGKNAICVLVYYFGRTCHVYLKGDPGLVFLLEAGDVKVGSDAEAWCRISRAYFSGPIYRINPFIIFAFERNEDMEDGWLFSGYTMDEGWSKVCVRENPAFKNGIILRERPVKKLRILDRRNTSIVAQGVFLRKDAINKNVAQLMQSDFLSYRTIHEVSKKPFDGRLPSEEGLILNADSYGSGDGIYLVIDLGLEEAGFLELEMDSEQGTVVDIAFGEQLDDLRVRAVDHDRNYAVRYVCKSGRQRYTHYIKRLAFRYLQLHISIRTGGRFSLHYAGIRPCVYPLERNGGFVCQDSLYNRIYEVSARTLELCMHEHYEDCPLREQAMYGMDSRNQALFGYYCFGNYDFAGACFDLLGHGMREDGFLHLVAPSSNRITIPHYSLLWINAIWDFCLFSGRTDTAAKQFPVVERIIGSCLKCMESGLIAAPRGEGYWHNYEWSQGLEGYDETGSEESIYGIRYDAPLNCFFCLALDDAAKLADMADKRTNAVKYRETSATIRKNFHGMFWNESKQIYDNYAEGQWKNRYDSEVTQALAICAGVCPENIAALLRQRIASENNGLEKTTLSYSIYKFSALLEEPDKYASLVFDKIAEDWGDMLYKGATSFWETIEGSRGFDNSGSMCHGWSAVPAYFYQAYILGVKPLKPGFELFEVKPLLPGIDRASGTVPTAYGNISVSLVRRDKVVECEISHPEKTVCCKDLNNASISIR